MPLVTPRSPSPDFDPLMLLAGAVGSIGWASDIKRWMAVGDAREAPPVIEGIFFPLESEKKSFREFCHFLSRERCIVGRP